MPKKEADTRKIVQGVQLGRGRGMQTYQPGQEDALEAALTPGEYATLKAAGALEGDWEPAGTPQVMADSKAVRESDVSQKELEAKAKQLDADRAKVAEASVKQREEDAKAAEKEHAAAAKGTPATGGTGHAHK